MKRTIKSIVALVAVAVAGVSCLQLEQPVLIENLSGDEIVFGADAYIEAQTKASSGTSETTSLTSFYVSAVTGSAGSESSAFASSQFTQVTGSSPAVYKGGKIWPASNLNYKFYASNRPLTYAAAGTTVTATNTTDVVCAYLTNGTYKTKNTLTFEHIFARFGRVDVAAESGYTISNISIRITPKTGGTYNLRTGAGQTDGTGWSSVTTGSSTVVASQTGANGNDIYLVPGTYQVTATWTATHSGTSITYTDKVVYVPIVGGKTNVVSVVLGGEITFGVDLAEYCNYDYRDNLDYLTFYADEAGTIGWKCSNASISRTIEYSKDFGSTWTSLTSTTVGTTVSVNAGDIVWFKGLNLRYASSPSLYNCFTSSNKVHVYGNVNSLTGYNEGVFDNCFLFLFNYCSNLYTYDAKKIVLPATTLANYCYYGMFRGCTSLTTAPDLPATTLALYCYYAMFVGCTSLTTAPELPVTTLASYCYSSMFSGCTSLTTAPELPATTLASYCYDYMFRDCTSLTTAPKLPATTLASKCYDYMFRGCTSLTTAPELPATTLADYCYYGMFQGCTALVKAPELPATALVTSCYNNMFSGCSSLNYIKAMFTTEPSGSYTSNWVSGVAATGTFVKSDAATWDVSGNNGVPTGWTVKVETEPSGPGQWMDNPDNYLRFKFITDGQVRWQNKKGDIQYSKNGGAWTAFNGTIVSMSVGDEIWFKGNLTSGCGGSGGESIASKFYTSGNFYVSGNVQSLCSFNNTLQSNHFAYLFTKCVGLNIDDNKPLILPATTMTNYCYFHMFENCTSLTSAPELPATTMAGSCYAYMFKDCTSLTSAPELPATTLGHNCYAYMFQGCTWLTSGPDELPATTLTNSCYQAMFKDCLSLTSAPELPATTLTSYCYESMFSNCSSLTTAPELPATTLAGSCYAYMFQGCSSLTSVPDKLPATTLAGSCYYSMFSSCTSLTKAPELPATTLVSNCYNNMFYYCSSLNYIKALFTTTPSSSYTDYWVYGIGSPGTFVKNASATWNVSGSSGVPYGWTVVLQ